MAPRKSSRRLRTLMSASSAASLRCRRARFRAGAATWGGGARPRILQHEEGAYAGGRLPLRACPRHARSAATPVTRHRRLPAGDVAGVSAGITIPRLPKSRADERSWAVFPVERRHDTRSEVGSTATFDELDQQVHVVAWITCNRCRERRRRNPARADPAASRDLVDGRIRRSPWSAYLVGVSPLSGPYLECVRHSAGQHAAVGLECRRHLAGRVTEGQWGHLPIFGGSRPRVRGRGGHELRPVS